MFWPPASIPPAAVRGEACSLIMAMRRGMSGHPRWSIHLRCCDFAEERIPITLEPLDAESLQRDLSAFVTYAPGLDGVGQEPLHRSDQFSWIGGDEAVLAVAKDLRHLRRGEADHGQANRHRLAYGKAEA